MSFPIPMNDTGRVDDDRDRRALGLGEPRRRQYASLARLPGYGWSAPTPSGGLEQLLPEIAPDTAVASDLGRAEAPGADLGFAAMADSPMRRLQRLAEELEESGITLRGPDAWRVAFLEEVDRALRPPTHERRIASMGTILDPREPPERWSLGTKLLIARMPVQEKQQLQAYQFADGLSSFLLRWTSDRHDEWLLFDRPAGSERDLVVLADTLNATVIQRHPSGTVRVVGEFGVLRYEGFGWHHEPPIARWLRAVAGAATPDQAEVLGAMLAFAVHDLGAAGIGALLVVGPNAGYDGPLDGAALRPPALDIRTATHLAPLRHALSQIDGAALFDSSGTLRQLGVRLVPTVLAEAAVGSLRGTRHTSGLRYSFDDPHATVIAVSEDGPVTVLRAGQVVARSANAL